MWPPHPLHHIRDCLFVMRGDATDWRSKPTQNPICGNCVVTSLIKQRLSAWCVHCHSLMGPLVQGNVVSLRSACYVMLVMCAYQGHACENQRIMSDIESELLHDSGPTTAPQTVAIIISSQVLPSSDLTWKRNSFFLQRPKKINCFKCGVTFTGKKNLSVLRQLNFSCWGSFKCTQQDYF